MEAISGLLIIGLIIGGVLLWQKATGAANKKLNQNVLDRKGHERGRKIVGTRLDLSTGSRSAEDLLQKVIGYCALPSEPPRLVGASYIEAANGTQAIIAMGNKMSRSAQLLLSLENNVGTPGCTGSLQVAKWTEADGVVAGYQEMERLFELVRQAAVHADAEASVTEAPASKKA